MWQPKIHNFVAMLRCTQKILLAYTLYAALQLLSCSLVKQLAIRLGCQKIPAKSLVMPALKVLNLSGVRNA